MSKEQRRFCRLANSPTVHSLNDRLELRLGKDLFECDVKGELLRHPLEAPVEDAATEKAAAKAAAAAEKAAEKAAAADEKAAAKAKKDAEKK